MDDEKWIEANLSETDEQIHDDFDMTLWLSTDGKHSVQVTAKTREGRKHALTYAQAVYDKLLEKYGTKQQANVKAYSNEKKTSYEETENVETFPPCPKCGAAQARSKKGNVFCTQRCWIK